MKFEEFKRKWKWDDLVILLGFPIFFGLLGMGIGVWIGYGNIPDTYFNMYNFNTMPISIMAEYAYPIAGRIGLIVFIVAIMIAIILWYRDFKYRSVKSAEEMLADLKKG